MKKFIVLGNFIGLIFSLGVIAKYFYYLMIYPWIKGELTGLTWTGVGVVMLAIYVFARNYEYFEERLK